MPNVPDLFDEWKTRTYKKNCFGRDDMIAFGITVMQKCDRASLTSATAPFLDRSDAQKWLYDNFRFGSGGWYDRKTDVHVYVEDILVRWNTQSSTSPHVSVVYNHETSEKIVTPDPCHDPVNIERMAKASARLITAKAEFSKAKKALGLTSATEGEKDALLVGSAKRRITLLDNILRLSYIKATRNTEEGEKRFICRDDVITCLHEFAKSERPTAGVGAESERLRIIELLKERAIHCGIGWGPDQIRGMLYRIIRELKASAQAESPSTFECPKCFGVGRHEVDCTFPAQPEER